MTKIELVDGLRGIDVLQTIAEAFLSRISLTLLHSQAQAFCGSCCLTFMVYYGHAFFVFIRKGGKRTRLGYRLQEFALVPYLLQWPRISILRVGPHVVHDSVDLLHAGLKSRFSFAAYVDRMCLYHPWVTLVNSIPWVFFPKKAHAQGCLE